MTPEALEHYLHEHIPLCAAMQVHVVSADTNSVVVSAPLAPNINHRSTLFGGSASAIAIVSAWSLLHVRLIAAGHESRIVIQRNTMDYLEPVHGDFFARSHMAPDADWDGFLRMLSRRGRARIALGAVLEFEGREAGRLSADFVALGPGR